MEIEKKERSYAKKKHKTEPSGIRFNISQLKIALAKSRKDTKQELVDFLIERYVNGENPILERKETNEVEIRKPTTIIRSAEQWHELKRSCESPEEWKEVKFQIVAAQNLTEKQKQIIINTP